MSPMGQDIFEALRDGLADFRAKVEGEAGLRVVALGSTEGNLPDLIRLVLGAVADALTWFASSLGQVEETLKIEDSALALLRLASQLLETLTPGLSFGQVPGRPGLEPRPFQGLEQAMAPGLGAELGGSHGMNLLPRPEHVAQVREELEKLLGQRVNPALPDAGSLGRLLAQVHHRHLH